MAGRPSRRRERDAALRISEILAAVQLGVPMERTTALLAALMVQLRDGKPIHRTHK